MQHPTPTDGVFCDYFSTAVRTGGEGSGGMGLSMLLIERGPGVKTSMLKTSYSAAAGTAYVVFEDVMVPVENLLGEENLGFRVIMHNFNHERWYCIVATMSVVRTSIEECMKWTAQRVVFGQPLAKQAVIRNKLAHMIGEVESCYAWLELITHQMNTMSYKDQQLKLAGPIALCKLRATRLAYTLNDHAIQIFGGRGITRSGMGASVERAARAVKYSAILGGSEEIMADLGVKMALKGFPKVGAKL
jgi:alkylation response protein AidB-like acyl-CoA dehydrogenase